ncbi:hypothetical protein M2118_001197 [Aurantimicrobium minutum]|nr:hypothetical protein [Aurantimicrobium minutum]
MGLPVMTDSLMERHPLKSAKKFWLSYWVPVSLLAISVAYLTTVTLMHTFSTSPIDEWVYIDYLVKIPSQWIVRKGEIVDPFVLNLLACHGTSPFGPIGTLCGEVPVLSDFPNTGISTADPYTPLYFYSAFGVGELVHFITGLPELTGWRLSGVVWFSGSIFFFWLLLRKWAVSNLTIFVFGLLLLSSPFVWWTYTYVSTDSSSLFFGALLLFVATKYIRNEIAGYWFVIFAVVASLFKIINLISVGVAAAYLLADTIWVFTQRRHGDSAFSPNKTTKTLVYQGLIGPIALALGAGAQWAWLRINSLMAASTLSADQGASHPFGIEELFIQLTSFLPRSIASGAVDEYIPGFVYAPLSWLTIVSVLAAVLVTLKYQNHFPLVVAVAASALLAAPLLAVMLTLVTHSYFQLPARYGAGLIPGMLLLGGLVIKAKWPLWVFMAYAISLLGLGVWFSHYLAFLAP